MIVPVALVAAIAVALWRCRAQWNGSIFRRIALRSTVKIVIGFYQIVSQLTAVCSITYYPPEYERLVSTFRIVNLHVFAWLPNLQPACLGMPTLLDQLLFATFAPIAVALAVVAVVKLRGAPLASALPFLLYWSFLVYPSVSSRGFRALASCDCFGYVGANISRTCFLRTDYEEQCTFGSRPWPEPSIMVAAWLAIILYGIAVPLLYAWLLTRKSMAQSEALDFLTKDYNSHARGWELVEVTKKLTFTGFLALVDPGSLTQMYLAVVCSVTVLVLQLLVVPYRRRTDNMLATLSEVALAFTLLGTLGLDMSQYSASPLVESNTIITMLVLAGLIVIIAAVGMLLARLHAAHAAGVHLLRYLKDDGKYKLLPQHRPLLELVNELLPNAKPGPTVPHAGPFHVFLSHNWMHGQDEMRIIKTRLREMLPGVEVFLDVDNLGGGSDHPHIDVSNCMLCYLTQKWFTSPPCLREFIRAVLRKKPLIALLEPDMSDQHGGHHEAECRRILLSAEYAALLEKSCPKNCSCSRTSVAKWAEEWGQPDLRLPTGEELVNALFASPPIVWYSLSDFQDVSMRLIGERLVTGFHHSYGDPYSQLVYHRSEVAQTLKRTPLKLPPPGGGVADKTYHLYISPNGPDGAVKMADELKERYLPTLTWTTDLAQIAACMQMVVPLTDHTWTRGAPSDAFEKDVCEAIRLGVERLLVHEVPGARLGDNEARHACTFEQIIAATPQQLLDAGLYNPIAMNMGSGEWREAGLAKTAWSLAGGNESEPLSRPRHRASKLLQATMGGACGWRMNALLNGWRRRQVHVGDATDDAQLLEMRLSAYESAKV